MKVSYFGGLAAHLLRQHPEVAKVEILADAGLDGPNWHPGWLKVTLNDGTAMVLNIARQASDTESADKPDAFRPEDLNDGAGQGEVSRLQGQHVR